MQLQSGKRMGGAGVWVSSLFILACFSLHWHGMNKKAVVCAELQEKIGQLEGQKRLCLEEREDLVLQISSQQDEDWIEMVLKKRLGVVPEGQVKVYFKKDE